MSYIYLSGAILCEVVGTMVLPLSENFSKPIPSLISIVAYVLAFYLLTFALESIPIAVVYATWSGLGIFLISFLGFTIYGQTLQWQSILGLLFIVVGVVLVNSFASVKQSCTSLKVIVQAEKFQSPKNSHKMKLFSGQFNK